MLAGEGPLGLAMSDYETSWGGHGERLEFGRKWMGRETKRERQRTL